MKKMIFTLLLFLTLSMNAQDLESVKFMVIPVDGTKENMISQLEQKGFKYDAKTDYLDGKFNGEDAILYVSTNKDVVDRIMVTFINPISETDIKIKFNRLVRQFENNEKYFSVLENQSIDDDVDISYQEDLIDEEEPVDEEEALINEELKGEFADDEIEEIDDEDIVEDDELEKEFKNIKIDESDFLQDDEEDEVEMRKKKLRENDDLD